MQKEEKLAPCVKLVEDFSPLVKSSQFVSVCNDLIERSRERDSKVVWGDAVCNAAFLPIYAALKPVLLQLLIPVDLEEREDVFGAEMIVKYKKLRARAQVLFADMFVVGREHSHKGAEMPQLVQDLYCLFARDTTKPLQETIEIGRNAMKKYTQELVPGYDALGELMKTIDLALADRVRFVNEHCVHCNIRAPKYFCTCKLVRYCSGKCQVDHWHGHKAKHNQALAQRK